MSSSHYNAGASYLSPAATGNKSPTKSSQESTSSTLVSSALSSEATAQQQPSNTSSTTPQPSHLPQPHQPYPYVPYGFPSQNQPQQPAYPHAPYYPPPPPPPPPHHPHAYPPPYPYPGYPPPPGYPSTSAHALAQPHPLYPPAPHTRVPAQMVPAPTPPAGPVDDLPSYEEMIVEALIDSGDPDGAAPKDLFTWMASRYPLQNNFRPSASQALQKAFKRGRLEKRPGGRYRLNPSWEGGTTSKRATRRPQTFAQTAYAMHAPPQQPSSPFTNAPLTHQPHPPPPQHPQYPHPTATQYPGYPYGYPPAGYSPYGAPGYPPYPPPPDAVSSAHAKPGIQSSTSASSSGPASDTKESEDRDGTVIDDTSAWEAAQHILKAINFVSLDASGPTAGFGSTSGLGGVPQANASHPPPHIAAQGFNPSVFPSGSAAQQRTALTDDERASLQAQLALLAAQLVEIADADEEEEEEEEEDFVHVTPPTGQTQMSAPANDSSEKDKGSTAGSHLFTEQSSTGDAANRAVTITLNGLIASATAQEDEESDDEADMEMVEVPPPSGLNPLRA
ncbi:hypothetical protein WOLCODRAFT_162233 [Wolfiporia cocos MD-104 SS10]|uniref:Histone H1 n=1 Tax=Wolfiporia cocos (strain MD-104) TaxID=742152 RepID=A0A2H3JR93_WOLCO|nr:hypothetical protein WOLCODRAFT_162233 [Wolfiporia cocos MD-104 SS10]